MKTLILTVILGIGLVADAVETPGGCANAACNYCESLAATCQGQAAATLNGTDCLCTERFKVNLARCLSGQICAWDGTGSPTPPICPDIYCPGSFDQSFIDECPDVQTSGLPIPSPTPSSTGQTGTSSTRTTGNTTRSPSGTDTTTRTNTAGGASSSSSSTSGTGAASAVQVPIALAGILAISNVLLF